MFAFLKTKILLAALLVCIAVILISATRASSQTGGVYDLSWNTIDGGGSTFAQGGNYSLGSTSGAADAGVQSGGAYILQGGFWSGTSDKRFVYLPITKR
jgi:hypothetical protein